MGGKKTVLQSTEERESGSIAVGMLWDARMHGGKASTPSLTQTLPHSLSYCLLFSVCKQRENEVL